VSFSALPEMLAIGSIVDSFQDSESNKEIWMKRSTTYSKDLTEQIKLRIDEKTFRKITQLSEEAEKNKSWFLRDLINNSLIIKS
jgi:aromatic ring-opening dioxygenase catalytic subunit (LigB family)